MRARALAQCLGMNVSMSVRGGQAAKAAAGAVGPVANDIDALKGIDLLVVDDPSPADGRGWIARARRAGICSVSVHDGSWTHDADIVVCGALGAERPRTPARALVGARFYLLDDRLADMRRLRTKARRRLAPHVVIALGGGQHVRRMAQRLVDAIVGECPGARIYVAAGFSRTERQPLRDARWMTSRADLMRALVVADVAVVAGGVTLYEVCALGVPAVGLAVVPEQLAAIRRFSREGAALDAGDASTDPGAIDAAARGVARLIGSAALRRSSSARARALVDGRGTRRVARHVQALMARNGRASE
jgi:spore coat polysaccharide biosynthesis predicted glycosyltransferase SpsG